MNNTNNTNYNSGISFFGLMFLLFLGLKLGKVISWSWWLICMPLYAPLALFLIIMLIIIIVALLLK